MAQLHERYMMAMMMIMMIQYSVHFTRCSITVLKFRCYKVLPVSFKICLIKTKKNHLFYSNKVSFTCFEYSYCSSSEGSYCTRGIRYLQCICVDWLLTRSGCILLVFIKQVYNDATSRECEKNLKFKICT